MAQRSSPPSPRWESPPTSLPESRSLRRPGPTLEVDPMWPKPLPNHWVMGNTIGVSVDARITSGSFIARARSKRRKFTPSPILPGAECCLPAPPVLEFDEDGNLIGHWGGPGQGYDWPDSNHGITVDYKGNVWIGGNGRGPQPKGEAPVEGQAPPAGAIQGQRDSEVHAGRKIPDADRQARPEQGQQRYRESKGPAKMFVDPKTNELYVADGYGNHRVIVFDADTGKYKRHWGAYGNKPDDTNLGNYNPDAPPRAAVPQPGALRRAFERQSALCLRPRERPHPGVQTRRDVRQGNLHRQEHAGRWVGVGHRVLEGSAAEVHLSGRWRERKDLHHAARHRWRS